MSLWRWVQEFDGLIEGFMIDLLILLWALAVLNEFVVVVVAAIRTLKEESMKLFLFFLSDQSVVDFLTCLDEIYVKW